MNKKNSFFKQRLYPIIFMACLTAIAIAPLSAFYLATLPLVKLNEKLTEQRAILTAAGVELPNSNSQTVTLYNSLTQPITFDNEKTTDNSAADSTARYFRLIRPGSQKPLLLAVVTGPGLWGAIDMVMAIDTEKKMLTGIEIIAQNETPGLGARITEQWFKKQFQNKLPPLTMEAAVSGDSKVDAISGATRSSNFLLNIVNSAFMAAVAVMGENN